MAKQISVRIDDKGRLTLPRSIRKALHVEPGDVFFLQQDVNGVHIVKSENPLIKHTANEYKSIRFQDIESRKGSD